MIVIMRDAVMPECCNTCVCSEGYGCGITGTEMTMKEMESRPDWCPIEVREECEDAVSREQALEELYDWEQCYTWDEHCREEHPKPKWIVAPSDVIKKLPSVTPKQRWIPCSERLPYAEYGESDTVLATCGYWDIEDESNRWIRMLYYDGGNWCYPTGETYPAKVYAWMPLPELYQEEGDK